ncbi:hypothetical protein RIF29_19801 [Crotalaria pallida]|uniref:Uncharacterized protein n=1 Tax=Crotalaria pallida TaxID=3830 RepID=A0AAN9F024_CROPI
MNSITILGSRMVHKISYCLNISRKLCNQPFHCCDDDENENGVRNGFELVEDPLKKMCVDTSESVDSNKDGSFDRWKFLPRVRLKMDVERVLDVLRQDDPEFDFR